MIRDIPSARAFDRAARRHRIIDLQSDSHEYIVAPPRPTPSELHRPPVRAGSDKDRDRKMPRSVTALDTVAGVDERDAWPEGPNSELVTRLLSAQAPHLAAQTVVLSANSGSSNWVFRLGAEYAVRLPRSESYVDDLRKEATWLPRLGPELPIPVPQIVVEGEPTALFERPWTVVTWVPGELPGDQDGPEQARLASTLGRFVQRLHGLDTGDLPAGA